MTIETTEDLCNQIANWIGVYGACKAEENKFDEDGNQLRDCNGCDNKDPLCCRVGFMIEIKDRMIAAVENDKKLESINM
jgi:hypothetical protein